MRRCPTTLSAGHSRLPEAAHPRVRKLLPRFASALALALVMAAAPAGSPAADGRTGLEATVTDTYDFQMKLTGLVFKTKTEAGAPIDALTLDHVPMLAGGKQVSLWLAQIDTATFAAADKGNATVKAVLQGRGEQVSGLVENSAKCFFEGQIADGPRKGNAARFPLSDVKSLKVHTKYESSAEAAPGRLKTPMPRASENVLWVSSVPLGADVYLKRTSRGGRGIREYQKLGTTPLSIPIQPGDYMVRVSVPGNLAAKLKPSPKLDENANPFEHDGWSEVGFRADQHVVESVSYEVRKSDGRAATLISLFQQKGLKLPDVVAAFPAGHNFHFDDKRVEDAIVAKGVPKTDASLVLDALHRGGKIIWQDDKQSLIIELVPGDPGWNIRPAVRPAAK